MPESQSSMIPKQHGSYHSSTGFLNLQFFSESSQNSFPSEYVYESRVRLVIFFNLGIFWPQMELVSVRHSEVLLYVSAVKGSSKYLGNSYKIFDTVSMQLLSYIICGYAILNT